MSKENRKFPFQLFFKIVITIVLFSYVINQIPWDDRIYIQKKQMKSLGRLISVNEGIVTYKDDQGIQHEVFQNQPIQVAKDPPTWWIVHAIDKNQAELMATLLEEVVGKLVSGKRPKADDTHVTLIDKQNKKHVIEASHLGGGLDYGVKPGFPTLLRSLNIKIFLLAFFMMVISNVVPALRWAILMRARQLVVSWWMSIKLCYMGYFFSQVMPGTSGGDVIRAIYIAKDNKDRAAAALSVFVDRLVGLFGISIIGTIAVVLQFDDPRISKYGQMMALIVGVLFVGACVYFSRTLRRLFHIETLLDKLPLGKKVQDIESKLFVYREHKMAIVNAFLLTGIIQVNFILVNYFLARSLGLPEGHLSSFFVFLPIVTVLVAFPISFGGFGFREFLFVKFFTLFGLNGGLGFATSLLQGMVMLTWSLAGGLAFLSLRKGARGLSTEENH